MSVPRVSPLTIIGVGVGAPPYDSNFEIETNVAHGMTTGATVTIVGGREASGILVPFLNRTRTVHVVDSTHFTCDDPTYTAGWSFGGSVWVQGAKVSAGTLTAFDSLKAARIADTSGDTLVGGYVVAGSGTFAVAGGGTVLTETAGAMVETTSSGNIVLGDNDDVQLLPDRTRTILISTLEAMAESSPTADQTDTGITLGPYAGQPFVTIGVQQNYIPGTTTGVQNFWIPLTRLHDKATLVSATLLFFPRLTTQSGLSLPTIYPTLQLFRSNPASQIEKTSMAVAGAAAFPVASSVASYTAPPAVGASGNISLVTLNGGSAAIAAGSVLTDAAKNSFKVIASGTYANGAPVPILAQAPAYPAVFYGGTTNDAGGTVLTWASAPTNCAPTQLVAPAGLSGGLNAGYAQSLVFTPDAASSVIDQSTFVYSLLIQSDNACVVNASPYCATIFVAVSLLFNDITSLAAG